MRALQIRFYDPEAPAVAVGSAMHPTGRMPLMMAVSVLGARDLGDALAILADGERFPQEASSCLSYKRV